MVLALAVVLLAADIVLPEPTGPHAVGRITLEWVDAARDREQVMDVWYPATHAKDAEKATYFDHVDEICADLREKHGPKGAHFAEWYDMMRDLRTHAVEEAAPLSVPPRAPAWPVVMFSPGGNGSRHFHTIQAEDLASHGYVVAVMSHLSSGLDWYPRAGFVLGDEKWSPPDEATPKERDEWFEPLCELLASDASAALDRLGALNKEGPRLAGRLDLKKVALAGHSRGGKTVSRALTKDKRFAAGLIFDNLPPMAERTTGFAVPILVMLAGDWEDADAGEMRAMLTASRAPSVEAVLDGAVHMSFSDAPVTQPERVRSSLDPNRSMLLLRECTRAFLDEVLRGGDPKALDALGDEAPELKIHRTPGR